MWLIKFLPVVALLLCGQLSQIMAYKYLVIVPFPAKSHFFIGSSLIKGLVAKGHDVTYISPYAMAKHPANLHHIKTSSVVKVLEVAKENLLDSPKKSALDNILEIHHMGLTYTDMTLMHSGVQNLLKSNATFDAIVCEIFLNEALFGIAEHFKAPLIGYSTFGASVWSNDLVGSPSPPSYVPHFMMRTSDHMSFTERMLNMAFITFDRLFMDFYYIPKQTAIYRKYFPNFNRTLDEISRNTALVLLNNHVSISFSRPYVANMIEVGGLHINRETKPLPENIQKFLDGATEGAIYFSMGSNLKSANLPVDKRNAIIETFRGLKHRVLWKFEDPKLLKNKPDNVFVSDWFPQDDVLAHPNVKLFITHGGLLSTTESIYHGKPVVGVPIFADQYLNMAKAAVSGYGVVVDYPTLSIPSFTAAIERILTDASFTQKAQDMSARFRDQETLPLDRAVYWMEHVVRQKGAQYLHCSGQDLNLIQYFSLDVMFVLYGGILFALVLVLLLLRFIISFVLNLFNSKSDPKPQRESKKKRN